MNEKPANQGSPKHGFCIFVILLMILTNGVTFLAYHEAQKDLAEANRKLSSPGVQAAEQYAKFESDMNRQMEEMNRKAEQMAEEWRNSAQTTYQSFQAEAQKTGLILQDQAIQTLGRIQEELKKFNETMEERQKQRQGP